MYGVCVAGHGQPQVEPVLSGTFPAEMRNDIGRELGGTGDDHGCWQGNHRGSGYLSVAFTGTGMGPGYSPEVA